ncbi:hypothetical protein GCM10023115_09070 [Pontixanthobacter gangjinensis]|uniref:TIR domain-containing protein n=1 Tax=Pontixanthobacter gangjinensis TaxID=1028742 RepID=A0A6I4SKB0_9SPHN|nr:TIR domain-containing protein [Pontixanthobacter gangjinensis]MXO56153.1 TIR domain-containing protein [Pontixanthobacter gangjinensis]
MQNSDHPASANHIFLSYSREDQPAALPIIKALQDSGIEVWWDGLIEGGAKYGLVTEEALETASAVVVIWSKTSIQSHWVRDEATHGRDRGRLVPVTIDKTDPPLGFGQFQCIDLSQKSPKAGDPQFDRLVNSIITVQGGSPALSQRPPRMEHRPEKALTRRNAIIGGGTAILGAAGLAYWMNGGIGSQPNENSIAVLPFTSLGDGTEQTYFAQGLSAEVRSRLAQNPLLKVSAQTSSDAADKDGGGAKDISRKLGVAYLLEGTVRRAGNQVRVVAELIDGATGFSIEPLAYDGALDDIFEIQRAIAAAVTQALTTQMDGASSGTEVGGTENIAAYEAFLQGRELYDAGIDENSDRQALAKFDEAIAIDANYAAAHAGRSRALGIIGNLYAPPKQRDLLYDQAILAGRKAVEIAPKFPDGHMVLGYALAVGELDMGKARGPYQTSYELGSGDADILSRYAIFRSRIGDYGGANKAINLSASLDPLNARTFRTIGDIAYNGARHDDALIAFEKAKDIQEGLSSYHYSVGLVKLAQGKVAEAKASFERESRSVWRLTGTAIADFRLGDEAEAQRKFDTLRAEFGDKSNYQYAQIYSQWGRKEDALAALAEAWRLRDSGLVQLYRDPLIEPIRDTTAYNNVIRKMGFTK